MNIYHMYEYMFVCTIAGELNPWTQTQALASLSHCKVRPTQTT